MYNAYHKFYYNLSLLGLLCRKKLGQVVDEKQHNCLVLKIIAALSQIQQHKL